MNSRTFALTIFGAIALGVVALAIFREPLLLIAEDWQPLFALVPPMLIAASALVAMFAVMKNEEVNRKRATLDLIEKSESSDHYKQVNLTFRKFFGTTSKPENRAFLHDPKTEWGWTARREVQQFLNHYELIAIGINSKSLHAKTYRDWMMTVFVRDWNSAADYIQRERWQFDEKGEKWLYRRKVYRNFEKLARRWARKSKLELRKISEKTTPPPERPSGPGDFALPPPIDPHST